MRDPTFFIRREIASVRSDNRRQDAAYTFGHDSLRKWTRTSPNQGFSISEFLFAGHAVLFFKARFETLQIHWLAWLRAVRSGSEILNRPGDRLLQLVRR